MSSLSRFLPLCPFFRGAGTDRAAAGPATPLLAPPRRRRRCPVVGAEPECHRHARAAPVARSLAQTRAALGTRGAGTGGAPLGLFSRHLQAQINPLCPQGLRTRQSVKEGSGTPTAPMPNLVVRGRGLISRRGFQFGPVSNSSFGYTSKN